MDNETINKYFELLADQLLLIELDCKNNSKRTASASEFMFMHTKDSDGLNIIAFKHIDTRNYLFLVQSILDPSWRLHIPKTNEAFQLGYFDIFEKEQVNTDS